MKLTHDNYFSPEAMRLYMSTSQFKQFEQCQAQALAELIGQYERPESDAFKEGKYFESCITGKEEMFLLQNPDMVSTRGTSKGELKSNFKNILGSVEAFQKQEFFTKIVKQCQQQVIVTGNIAGVHFKGCVDFFTMTDIEIKFDSGDSIVIPKYSGIDTKCMRDFKKVYSEPDKMYVAWYFAYRYNYQSAIYKELIRQTYGEAGEQFIFAATKESMPDVAALRFSDELLENSLEIVREYAPLYHDIKVGITEAERCEICAYCKQTKVITDVEVVDEYE